MVQILSNFHLLGTPVEEALLSACIICVVTTFLSLATIAMAQAHLRASIQVDSKTIYSDHRPPASLCTGIFLLFSQNRNRINKCNQRGAYHLIKSSYALGKNPFAFKQNSSKALKILLFKKSRIPFRSVIHPLQQNIGFKPLKLWCTI